MQRVGLSLTLLGCSLWAPGAQGLVLRARPALQRPPPACTPLSGLALVQSVRGARVSSSIANDGDGDGDDGDAAASSGNATATVSWRQQCEPERTVPEVSLTRSRDGSTGTATFRFWEPSCLSLHDVWERGLITGLWLRDEEGELMTADLDVTFERGRPRELTAILVLKSGAEWDRFMRFMKRYADQIGLAFEPSGSGG